MAIDHPSAAARLASLERPFSVFSPGLAGVSKTEQFVSDGVLLRTIARGDANLELRNILYRLWDTPEWDPFLLDLREIFPDIEFTIAFQESIDEFISVKVLIGGELIPLELVGTGVLQAAQILSYIHRFSPHLVVLDEPDSHLHPNNQRLLCALLRRVAEERDTQILLTTHSRHVVDSIGGNTRFLWVRNGTVDPASEDDEIGILLDIGALDVKERVEQPNTRAVILTEDENSRALEGLLAASGVNMAETVILPYYGVSTIKQLRPLVRMIAENNPNAAIALHRDRDYLTDDEINDWEVSIRNFGVEPIVTQGVDVESHLLNVDYLASLNPAATREDFARLIQQARADCENTSIAHYVNGRIQIARAQGAHANINHGRLAVEAAATVRGDPVRYGHGKTVLKALRQLFRQEYGLNLKDIGINENLAYDRVQTFSRRAFGN